MAKAQKFTFFWRAASPFSQWHSCKFHVDGICFNTAEQYMMYSKAKLFNDDEVAEKILKTTSPGAQKSLGRKVKNFNENVWKENCFQIVKDGNKAKFSQNKELKKALFDTVGSVLVEASPHDKIWGIGLAEEDPLAHNKETWQGQNLLGYALTEVRDELMTIDQQT